MKKNNIIAGLILLVFFAAALVMALSFPTESSYFPIFICGLGILLSLVLIISALVRGKGSEEPVKKLSGKAKKMIAIMTGLIVLYAIGMTTIGFAVSTFIFIVVSGFILYPEKITKENKKPAIIIVTAALVVSVLITVIFKNVLYVPLPSGLLI